MAEDGPMENKDWSLRSIWADVSGPVITSSSRWTGSPVPARRPTAPPPSNRISTGDVLAAITPLTGFVIWAEISAARSIIPAVIRGTAGLLISLIPAMLHTLFLSMASPDLVINFSVGVIYTFQVNTLAMTHRNRMNDHVKDHSFHDTGRMVFPYADGSHTCPGQ